MKKRYYSLLALPLVATMAFAGCGETKRNAKELSLLHTETVNMFNATKDDYSTNSYFVTVGNNKQTFYVKYDVPYEVEARSVITENIKNYEDLLIRYNQLHNVYGKTMTMAYSYYAEFREQFMEDIMSKKPDEKKLGKLYDKMKEFQREISSFNTAKNRLEDDINLFGASSQIIANSVDTFNQSYNNLIGKTLDMVNYFKDLHQKYFFGDNVVDAFRARVYYQDGLLTLANYIYKNYLVSMESNGVARIFDIGNASTISTMFAIEKDDNIGMAYTDIDEDAKINSLVGSKTIGYNGANCKINEIYASTIDENIVDILNNPSLKDTADYNHVVDRVNNFKTALDSFKRYLNLYNKVYDKIDMYKLNNYRFKTIGGYDSIDSYYADLKDSEEVANARVVVNFENETIENYLTALIKITKED